MMLDELIAAAVVEVICTMMMILGRYCQCFLVLTF